MSDFRRSPQPLASVTASTDTPRSPSSPSSTRPASMTRPLGSSGSSDDVAAMHSHSRSSSGDGGRPTLLDQPAMKRYSSSPSKRSRQERQHSSNDDSAIRRSHSTHLEIPRVTTSSSANTSPVPPSARVELHQRNLNFYHDLMGGRPTTPTAFHHMPPLHQQRSPNCSHDGVTGRCSTPTNDITLGKRSASPSRAEPLKCTRSSSRGCTGTTLLDLPAELLTNCLMFLPVPQIVQHVAPTCKALNTLSKTDDQLWLRLLQQLVQQWPYFHSTGAPLPDNLPAWTHSSYAALYRSLCQHGSLFGHWYSENVTSLGQYIDVSYDTKRMRILLTQVDVDRIDSQSRIIGDVQLTADATNADGRPALPQLRLYSDGSPTHQNGDLAEHIQLQQHVARVHHASSNKQASKTITTLGASISSVCDWRGNNVDVNQLHLSSGTLPSRRTEFSILVQSQLPTPHQRRRPECYYAREEITMHRIPLIPLPKQLMANNASDDDTGTVSSATPSASSHDTRQVLPHHMPWYQSIADGHASNAARWVAFGFPEPGLYYGSYGPHGNELLYCYYTAHELVAMKIVADANVPSGKISFRIDCRSDQEREDQIAAARLAQQRRQQQRQEEERQEASAAATHAGSSAVRQPQPAYRLGPGTASIELSPSTTVPRATSLNQGPPLQPGDEEWVIDPERLSMEVPDEPADAVHQQSTAAHHLMPVAERARDLAPHELRDINESMHVNIIRAAAGQDLDVVDVTGRAEDADSDADSDDEDHIQPGAQQNIIARFMAARQMIPIMLPTFDIVTTRPGQGCIAAQGYKQARLIPLVAHFHQRSVFSLDFLGLILFQPFKCRCHQHIDALAERDEAWVQHVYKDIKQQRQAAVNEDSNLSSIHRITQTLRSTTRPITSSRPMFR